MAAAKPRGGRPPKLDDARAADITRNIEAGVPEKAAAEAAGIGYSTFLRWMQQGRQQQRGRYREFRDSVIQARARATTRNVAVLQKAATGYDVEEVEEEPLVRGGQVVLWPEGHPLAGQPVMRRKVKRRREFDWRAADRWLERRRRDLWAPPPRSGDGSDGGKKAPQDPREQAELIRQALLEMEATDGPDVPVDTDAEAEG